MQHFITLLVFILAACSQQASGQNFKYDRAGAFKDGLAPVYSGKLVGYIDTKGKEVVPVIYEEDYVTDEFTGGVAIVTKNGLSGLVDKTGKLVVPCEYKRISSFSEGIAEAQNSAGKVGFIDTKGKAIAPYWFH